jgi:circadian clock protein KaiB
MTTKPFLFTLYVAGNSARSQRAAANLRRLGEEKLGGNYELTVVDIVSHPESAETERILTTPTLVKEHPGPSRRVTGDLSDPEMVLFALALNPLGQDDMA